MSPPDGGRAWTRIGAATLAGVVIVATAVALLVGGRDAGRVQAIILPAGICLAGGLGGWFAGRLRPADPAAAVGVGLAAVCLRFFPAVATLLWLRSAGDGLRRNGGAEWFLIFYLTVLATDILLHMIGARRDSRRRGGSEN